MLFKIQTVLILAFLSISTNTVVVNASSLRRGAAALPHHRHLLLGDGDQQDSNKISDRNLQNATLDSTTTEPTVTLTETIAPTASPTEEESWEDLSLLQKIVGAVGAALILVAGYWFCCIKNYFEKCILATFSNLHAPSEAEQQRQEEQRRREEQKRQDEQRRQYEWAAWEQQQQQQQ
jgi:hypothetical protein